MSQIPDEELMNRRWKLVDRHADMFSTAKKK
jgi:hypothetical protein